MPSAGAQPATLAIAANSNAASASAELIVQFLPRDAPAATCIPAPCQGPASGTGTGGSGRAVVVRVTGLLVAEGTPLDEQLQAGCIFTPISCIRLFVFSHYARFLPLLTYMYLVTAGIFTQHTLHSFKFTHSCSFPRLVPLP